MHHEVAFWHYVVGFLCFVLFGLALHVCRAVFNVFPDRLTDKPLIDMMISDDYNFGDWLFGTEFDDAGYYKLESWHNLRIAVILSAGSGLVGMLCVSEFASAVAYGLDTSFAWLWALFLYRLQTVELI